MHIEKVEWYNEKNRREWMNVALSVLFSNIVYFMLMKLTNTIPEYVYITFTIIGAILPDILDERVGRFRNRGASHSLIVGGMIVVLGGILGTAWISYIGVGFLSHAILSLLLLEPSDFLWPLKMPNVLTSVIGRYMVDSRVIRYALLGVMVFALLPYGKWYLDLGAYWIDTIRFYFTDGMTILGNEVKQFFIKLGISL